MSHHYAPWIVGFAFSVVVGHWAIRKAMTTIWRATGVDQEPRTRRWQAAALGLLERTLFTAAILAGQAEFIAVWLGVKTIAGYRSWGDERSEFGDIYPREVFAVFLMGQGLSIGFAAAGAFGATLLRADKTTPALLIGVASLLGTAAFAEWIKRASANTDGAAKGGSDG